MPRSWLLRIALNLLAASFFAILGEAGPNTGDYWMYIGTDTATFAPYDSKGIYVLKFHSANGRVDPAQVAAERVPLRFARIRSGWPISTTILHGVQNPTYLAVHPNGRYLYTADTNRVGTVSAFQVNPSTGMLTSLNVKPSAGGQPVFVAVDRTGRNLLVANFDGTAAVLPIGADGRLRDVSSVMEHRGSGSDRSIEPHPHSVSVSPDNRFAVVTDTGLDGIFVYRFDAVKGALSPNNPPFLKTVKGFAPRQLGFHPNGVFAYAISESGSSVDVLRWDAQRGIFTLLGSAAAAPPDYSGGSSGTEVVAHADGGFLYAALRGCDTITVFSIDPANSALKPLQYASTHGTLMYPHALARGDMPRNFCIDPTGRYLFVANSFAGNVVEFQIDQRTGRVTPTGFSVKIPSPHCITFAPAQ